MVQDRQKVRTEGQTEWTDRRTHGQRQNYIPPTSSGDKNGVKILPICNTNFHWIQLRKELFYLRQDLFICTVYYPPRSSTYLNNDNSEVFELLEKDIFMYQNLGHNNLFQCSMWM